MQQISFFGRLLLKRCLKQVFMNPKEAETAKNKKDKTVLFLLRIKFFLAYCCRFRKPYMQPFIAYGFIIKKTKNLFKHNFVIFKATQCGYFILD